MPVPPLKGDSIRRSTVLPYLEAHHYEADRDHAGMYFTEHDINGEWKGGRGRVFFGFCTNIIQVGFVYCLLENTERFLTS